MTISLLVIALQLQVAAVTPAGDVLRPPTRPAARAELQVGGAALDSARDVRAARGAQAAFERRRRGSLPWESGGAGRCQVRLGRYCWWYDESQPHFPDEAPSIVRARADLLRELDSLGARRPGDEWIAGMRVHYRLDGHLGAAADSAAQQCGAVAWWCAALRGYAAHVLGNGARADSAFADAERAMPTDVACEWRDISALLPDELRGRYEHVGCESEPRGRTEERYWLLSRPQLGAAANDWHNEFRSRRVITRLAERAANPHGMAWGRDAAELVLRYGWPEAWGRVTTSGVGPTEPSVIGHDASPSWVFAPAAALLDSLLPAGDDAWELRAPLGESRFAPRLVKRIGSAAVQIARFRRGDSTLFVAAYSGSDDSLRTPSAMLAVAGMDGRVRTSASDSSRRGVARLVTSAGPALAGVEITDTLTRTLLRARQLFAPQRDSLRVALSDLLVYRPRQEPAPSLEAALPGAIAGDTASRTRPLGVYWETYGLAADGEPIELTVSVERVDRGWLRTARQRLGLAGADAPVRIHWSDTRRPVDGVAAHAISLDLGNLPGGRYRVRLSVTPADGVPITTSRDVELQER